MTMLRKLLLICVALATLANAFGRTPADDDRDVIQTAMLSFFQHESWHSADWKPRKHVVLRPQYTAKTRPDFAAKLTEMIAERGAAIADLQVWLASSKPAPSKKDRAYAVNQLSQMKADLATLREIQPHIAEGQAYIPAAITQPASMKWDPRIKVTATSNRFVPFGNGDKTLESNTVYASVSPPAYSPNGRYAIITMGIPWSIHGASVVFLFERTGDTWTRRAVIATFYV